MSFLYREKIESVIQDSSNANTLKASYLLPSSLVINEIIRKIFINGGDGRLFDYSLLPVGFINRQRLFSLAILHCLFLGFSEFILVVMRGTLTLSFGMLAKLYKYAAALFSGAVKFTVKNM